MPTFTTEDVENTAALLERFKVALEELEARLDGEIKRQRREHLALVREEEDGD